MKRQLFCTNFILKLKKDYFQLQSPLDVESNPNLTANVNTDSDPDHETDRQSRRSAAPQQPNAPGASDGGEDDLGIAGQASNMWNQTVNQNPEISGVLKALEKYIPFIVIVTVKCLFEHATGNLKSSCLICYFPVF